MSTPITNAKARQEILHSIRSHLASSLRHEREEISHGSSPAVSAVVLPANGDSISIVESFRESLEAVNGHCIIAHGELEIVQALTEIITALQATNLRARRIALSNSPVLERLVNLVPGEVDELCIAPSAADLFSFDVGITTAQAAIAETGTLVLDSSSERHRLTSLIPPVHIAIIDAGQIHQTLGETLSALQSEKSEISPIVTFVTGPSRTADIELTLAIGVHGPQELYVIVNEGTPMAVS